MSTAWLKNFVGLKQSDYEMLKVPRPRVEYGIHMTVRAMQAGALVGSIFGPLMVIYRGGKLVERNGDISNLKDAVADGGSCGAIIGAMLGPVLTYFALRNMNSIRVYDHCYRLRFSFSLSNFETYVLESSEIFSFH